MPRIETIVMEFPDGSSLEELMQAHLEQKSVLGGKIIGIGSGNYFEMLEDAEYKIHRLLQDSEGPDDN